jgi:hypothetical protein
LRETDRMPLALGLVGLVGLFLIFRFVTQEARPNYYLLSTSDMYSGESEALPPIIKEALTIVRRHNVKTVTLDPMLQTDPHTYERLVEGLYPIRVDSTGKLRLSDVRDIPEQCRSIERGRMIVLVECN